MVDRPMMPVPPVEDGWPAVVPGARVVARDGGVSLGALILDQRAMSAIQRRGPVLSLRIDQHPDVEWWVAQRENGSLGHVKLRVPREPVRVPAEKLTDYVHFMEWAQSAHGFEGRLLIWDRPHTWWITHDPYLELTLICAPEDMLTEMLGPPGRRDERDWHTAVVGPWTDEARGAAEAMINRYGLPPPSD